MAKQRVRFVDGAVERGGEQAQAGLIFDLVDKFAGYGFNKSHAAAYALLAYHTAYLKANYPVEFLAATMTLDMGNTDKLAMFVDEARRLEVDILPPCVNVSTAEFEPEDGGIRYAMAAVKNVGGGAIEGLVATRSAGGAFGSIADFASRVDPKAVNKRCVEMLACAGAFDRLHPDRAQVFANADNIIAVAQKTAADKAAGQDDLFAMGLGGAGGGAGGGASAAGAAAPGVALELRPAKPWRSSETLTREHDAIGFYLTGHPIDTYESVLDKLDVTRWADFEANAVPGMTANFAATVTACRLRRSAKGNRFAFVAFSDPSGQFEALVFSDTLAQAEACLEPGTTVMVRATADGDPESDDNSFRLRAGSIEPLDKLVSRLRRRLSIVVQGKAAWPDLKRALRDPGQGEIFVQVRLPHQSREVVARLPGKWDLNPEQIGALETVPGVVAVRNE